MRQHTLEYIKLNGKSLYPIKDWANNHIFCRSTPLLLNEIGMSATFQGDNPVAQKRDRNGRYQGVNIRRNGSHRLGGQSRCP